MLKNTFKKSIQEKENSKSQVLNHFLTWPHTFLEFFFHFMQPSDSISQDAFHVQVCGK